MPYVSDKQRRFFHSPGAKKAGISAATVSEFDQASKGRSLSKKKKMPTVTVNNRLKGSFGATEIVGNKPTKIEVNVKRHKGDKAELADTIHHEMMHAKHPNMKEKTVRNKTANDMKTMSQAEKDKLVAKVRRKKLNYATGAVKRKLKIGAATTEPGELISKAKSMGREQRVSIMGAV